MIRFFKRRLRASTSAGVNSRGAMSLCRPFLPFLCSSARLPAILAAISPADGLCAGAACLAPGIGTGPALPFFPVFCGSGTALTGLAPTFSSVLTSAGLASAGLTALALVCGRTAVLPLGAGRLLVEDLREPEGLRGAAFRAGLRATGFRVAALRCADFGFDLAVDLRAIFAGFLAMVILGRQCFQRHCS